MQYHVYGRGWRQFQGRFSLCECRCICALLLKFATDRQSDGLEKRQAAGGMMGRDSHGAVGGVRYKRKDTEPMSFGGLTPELSALFLFYRKL